MTCFIRTAILPLLVLGLCTGAIQATALSVDERVAAREALERTRYAHQIGAIRPFEELYPPEVLLSRVRDDLRMAVGLDRLYGEAPGAKDLEIELNRMSANSRMPERLDELFDALDRDPLLIQECLVRPLLVERRLRAQYSLQQGDGAGSETERAGFDTSWKAAAPGFDPADAGTVASADVELPALRSASRDSEMTETCTADHTWDRGFDSGHPGPRLGAAMFWTGNMVLFWGGGDRPSPGGDHWLYNWTGHRYDPATDTWSNMTGIGAPAPRHDYSVVWTGDEMIIWGGNAGMWPPNDAPLHTGGRYDPVLDQWTETDTSSPLVQARYDHAALWTGTEMMLIWGVGCKYCPPLVTLMYNPATDGWRQIPEPPPHDWSDSRSRSTVWAGNVALFWGTENDSDPDGQGLRYDLDTDTWSYMSTVGEPDRRTRSSSVWTGDRVLYWGGYRDGVLRDDGAAYFPATDTWEPMGGAPPPPTFGRHSFWTGSEMLVWGRSAGPDPYPPVIYLYDPVAASWSASPATGGPESSVNMNTSWMDGELFAWGEGEAHRWHQATDTWRPAASNGPPRPRDQYAGVWTGTEFLIWGGEEGLYDDWYEYRNTGYRYDPAADAWTAMSSIRAPEARVVPLAIWTGTEMIVWGGRSTAGELLQSGGRYDPYTETWAPTALTNAPVGRSFAAAVWTGSEMVIWGGQLANPFPHTDSGSRYDPVSDTWTPTTLAGAPSPRRSHTAVWTDSEMIVWGGADDSGVQGAGARWDPASDSWTPVTDTGVPVARTGHTAVWSGSEMIVWGGSPETNSGGRYDPGTDSWAPTSTVEAPQARGYHMAVWTPYGMFVWGGPSYLDPSGGLYDPVTDSWEAVSLVNAPTRVTSRPIAWTGSHVAFWTSHLEFADGGFYALGHDHDDDGDGLSECAGDCNDGSTAVYPGAPQICDGVNNDCSDPNWPDLPVDEADTDGDSFSVCETDCDDGDPTVYPGAPQACNGVNSDCDDPAWPALPSVEVDDDEDTFSECAGDCDDSAIAVYPGAPQLCDGINNDCDDPNWPLAPADEADGDTDGHGICQGDCDDHDDLVYPGALQICDGVNNDCDDPGWPDFPPDEFDADLDGFRVCQDDCNDGDAQIHPGAFEICNDTDDDCDTLTDEDEFGEDTDLDGVRNLCDNCRDDYNPAQNDGERDGFGDTCDNCLTDYNPSQSDFDADSEGDRCDLDDGMIYIFINDPMIVDWQEEAGFGKWNSYKGDLQILKTTGTYTQAPGSNDLASMECRLRDPWASDALPPAVGTGAFFLTSGVSGSTEGGLGEDSSGAPRPNDNPCP